MQEVTVRLRFTRECLGSARKSVDRDQIIYAMLRDVRGHVLFLPTWWQRLMSYAAHVVGRHQELVDKITWDPRVDGRVVLVHRRVVRLRTNGTVKRAGYAVHEGFPADSVIGVSAILPHGMSVEWFQRLLATVGRYKGMSPFQMEDPYGTFEVVSIHRTVYGDAVEAHPLYDIRDAAINEGTDAPACAEIRDGRRRDD